ncbi:MAG: ribonuclease P protein component [bacterium]
MLPKKNRADKKAVEKIFKDGFFVGSRGLNLKYILENSPTPPRVSFVVPKSVEKKAVRRNYLRRRGYIVLEKYFHKLPAGFCGVLIFNKINKAEKVATVVDREINVIFNRLKFIKKTNE